MIKSISKILCISFTITLIYIIWIDPTTLIGSTPHHNQYFQQHVRYEIDVSLDIKENILDVHEILVYTNNSPDTLSQLFFHLYINKYRRHSLVYPNQTEDRGWIEIEFLSENDSLNNNFTIDHTLMNLDLYKPVYPDDSVRFEIKFQVKLPSASGRYGYQGLHYDVGNWYVTPVVYDRAGWHLHQHLDNEFYQEWGDYLVTIRVPQDFRVGATGNLLNSSEVLPLLDSSSPDWMRADYSDSVLIPWEYKAKKVHDFAWTTDPSYELLQAEWNGITLNVLVMDYNLESWQQVTDWGIKGLQYLSETFGHYPYDQMTIADTYITAGGIEYPQIVMINDFINPDYEEGEFKAVVLHEMAHNWFYGLLANNQLEHEWLDEGFTSFAEIKVMEEIFGREGNMNPGNRGWLFDNFGYNRENRSDQAYSYLRRSKLGLINDPIDLHADYLESEGYILQYTKMANVLFMLEYTLGDSIFNRGMRNYFDTWCYRHPYPDDFIAVMEKTSERDLDWFFDQWLRTNRKLDYGIEKFDDNEVLSDSINYYSGQIQFRRKEQIFMPLNFSVHLKNEDIRKYRIPVDGYSGPYQDAEILPYWHFSKDTHTVQIKIPDEIDRIEIDPQITLLDINRLDNYSGFMPPMEWHFMRLQSRSPPLNRYLWEIWPLLFYNDIDNLKIGAHLNGSYLNIDHKIYFNLWYKMATNLLDFDFHYQTPVPWVGKLSDIEFRLFTLDGRQGGRIGIIHKLAPYSEPEITMRLGIANHQMFDEEYLMNIWGRGNVNSLYLSWERRTTYRGWNPKQRLFLKFHTSVIGSEYQYSQIYFVGSHKFWDSYSDTEFDVRLFSGYGENDVPPQYLFNLTGDNSWGEFQHIFYRSKGSLPWPWRRKGNLYQAGGPEIKGYAIGGYYPSLFGKNALAINLDLKLGNPFDQYLPYYLRLIFPHIFFDYGNVWNGSIPSLDTFKASTGLSFSWESLDLLDYVFSLKQIRIDFPLWLSNPPFDQKNLEFRWLIRFDFN